MSKWNHRICNVCWQKRNPNREPVKLKEVSCEDPKPCCFCGSGTWSEIYVRHDGALLPCKGDCDV